MDTMSEKNRISTEDYISVTREPEQVMPFQFCPHGSSPFPLHCVSCPGEFILLNMTLRAEAA